MVEQWLQDIEDQEVQKLHQNLDQEFLVTKTIGNAEVWADFQAWRPSSQQEYDQLVKKMCNVRQITKDQLQKMASEMKLPLEILPGKIVHTRKSGSGAYGSRAVICGNDAGPDNNEHYAGGVDGQQVRTMVRLGALKQWQIGLRRYPNSLSECSSTWQQAPDCNGDSVNLQKASAGGTSRNMAGG